MSQSVNNPPAPASLRSRFLKTIFRGGSKEERVSSDDGSELDTNSPVDSLIWKRLADNDCEQQLIAIEQLNKLFIDLHFKLPLMSRRLMSAHTLDVVWLNTAPLIEQPEAEHNMDKSLRVQPALMSLFVCMNEHQSTKMSAQLRVRQFYTICNRQQRLSSSVISQSATSSDSQPINVQMCECLFHWLCSVVDKGAHTTGIEAHVFECTVDWVLLVAHAPEKHTISADVCTLMCNLIEHNAVHLSGDCTELLLSAMLQLSTHYIHSPISVCQKEELVLASVLSVVERLIAHVLLSRTAVDAVLLQLCHLLNVQCLCERVWRVTRTLFTSHMRFAAVHSLCQMLNHSDYACPSASDLSVLRAAVCLLAMGLWGTQRVDTLLITPAAVLPYLQKALVCRSAVVTYEVLLSVCRLVEKFGASLQLVTWSAVLQILETAVDLRHNQHNETQPVQVQAMFTKVLSAIESLYDAQLFGGSAERLFVVIERCVDICSEQSISRLLTFRAASVFRHRHNWQHALLKLMQQYYEYDLRTVVRLRALETLHRLFEEHRHLRAQELLDSVLLPVLNLLPLENDIQVHERAVGLLCHVARGLPLLDTITCSGNCSFIQLLRLLTAAITTPLSHLHTNQVDPRNCHELKICEDALCSLRVLLYERWPRLHATHALAVYQTCVQLLYVWYTHDLVHTFGGSLRQQLIEIVFGLSCNGQKQSLQLQCTDSDSRVSSAFIGCAHCTTVTADNHTMLYSCSQVACVIAGEDSVSMSAVLLQSVCKEKYWPALQCTLRHIRLLLYDRHVLLTHPVLITQLCDALFAINTPDTWQAIVSPNNDDRDLREELCPLFCALLTYKQELSPDIQIQLVQGVQQAILCDRSHTALVCMAQCIILAPDIIKSVAPQLTECVFELGASSRMAIAVLELLCSLLDCTVAVRSLQCTHLVAICRTLCLYVDAHKYTLFIVAHALHILMRCFALVPLQWKATVHEHIIQAINTHEPEPALSANGGQQTDSEEQQLHADLKLVLVEFLQRDSLRVGVSQTPAHADAKLTLAHNSNIRYWMHGNSIVSVYSNPIMIPCPSGTAADDPQRKISDVAPPSPDKQRSRHRSAAQPSINADHRKLSNATDTSRDDSYLPGTHQPNSLQPAQRVVGQTIHVRVRNCWGSSEWSHTDTMHRSAHASHALHMDMDMSANTEGHLALVTDPRAALTKFWPQVAADAELVPVTGHDVLERSIRNLDRMQVLEIQTIGVLYATHGQVTEQAILSNEGGSIRYRRFVQSLGKLTPLCHNQNNTFLGGLSSNGKDGQFTYVWEDSCTQLCWHVATLMPSAQGNNHKKRHIGNDFVVVVYNESGQTFNAQMLSGQCIHVIVLIQPVDHLTVSVTVLCKDEIARWLSLKECCVPDWCVGVLCRHVCMRATLSATIWRTQLDDPHNTHLSSAVRRLRHIRHTALKATLQ